MSRVKFHSVSYFYIKPSKLLALNHDCRLLESDNIFQSVKQDTYVKEEKRARLRQTVSRAVIVLEVRFFNYLKSFSFFQ